MRLLLVEDEPDLGGAIKKSLTQEAYIVDWVLDGTEAWYYLDNQWTEYTLAIVDWLLPGMSGLELVKRVRSHKDKIPILMLTAKDAEEDKVTGLDAGADDYLIKPFGMRELLARLRALQRRFPQLQPQQLQVGGFTLDYNTHMVWYGENKIDLTLKEFQLLEYFLQHPNQVLTRERILDRLWEIGAEPMSNVVAAQIRLLRKKLAQYNCEKVIETVYGLGYRFVP